MYLKERRPPVVVAHADCHRNACVLQLFQQRQGTKIVLLASVQPGEVAEHDRARGKRVQLEDLGHEAGEFFALVDDVALDAVDVDVAQQHGEVGIVIRRCLGEEPRHGRGCAEDANETTTREVHIQKLLL